jgi:hydrogenase nickel incorporation protein HypA/HybF
MHEVSIAHSMTELIESRLGRKTLLKTVSVTIGPLSGVSPEALSFCFPEVACKTGLGRPVLEIQEEKAEAECLDCGASYPLDDFLQVCSQCQSMQRRLIRGDRLTVDSVELLEENHV